MDQIKRLNAVRERQGTLNGEDEALFRRCGRLIARLKGKDAGRSHAEGHDSSITFSVLAAEGFLPGYGLESGYVVAWAEIPFWLDGAMDFVLPRAPATALREYVPGNLIYANGHRFVARRFHRDFSDEHVEMPRYEVSAEHEAVKETTAGVSSSLGGEVLSAMAVCDVDLVHNSHISDDEELRFQLGVAVYGLELGQHAGGTAYRWGDQHLLLRRGVRMRLVNVGVSEAIKDRNSFGYPVCTICGQSVSPLSSELQRESFRKSHNERCGRKPDRIGFYADIAADALSLPDCTNATKAYSVLEALRIGATRILDMHMEDLQILVIGEIGNETVQGLLWDPMPGGRDSWSVCTSASPRSWRRPKRWLKAAQELVSHPVSTASRHSATRTTTTGLTGMSPWTHSKSGVSDWPSSTRFRRNNQLPPRLETQCRSTWRKRNYATYCCEPVLEKVYVENRSSWEVPSGPRHPTSSTGIRKTISAKGCASISTG